MLLFYGKPASDLSSDENASRAARLKALRAHFYAWKQWSEFAPTQGDRQTHAIQFALNEHKKLSELAGDASILVLNAHGNSESFNGQHGEQLAANLLTLGIDAARTREVWVAACCVSEQEQDNSHPPSNLVKELYRHLREHLPEIKVYGPRALLSYGDKQLKPVGSGQNVIEYGRVYIRAPEKAYAFNEGWLLATLP